LFILKNIFYIALLFLAGISVQAQLGFCTGSKGNAIFFENFGSGTNFGPPLPAGTTTYSYTAGIPNDGQYTLHYMNGFNNTWHNVQDHTFNDAPDGVNGKALIVNASTTPGEFYRRLVTGLCVNTTFEFSAWVMNIYNSGSNACSGTGIPIDVTFEIWDASETTLLKTGSTGSIAGTPTPIWKQYGLTFTTLPGQTSVVLKMKNNGAGGCGNDLAIDDIAFNSCGDYASINTPSVSGSRFDVCDSNLPMAVPLNISISNVTPHVFQWQESLDTTFWTNIPGQNSLNFTPNITQTKFFRVIIAQDAANLANPFCYTISDTFAVVVTPIPAAPVSSGDVLSCSDDAVPPLGVTTGSGISADWFDAPIGGNLLQANATSYAATVSGTYYAEAVSTTIDCRSLTRTPVKLTISETPQVSDEQIVLCPTETKILDAGVPFMQYLWSSGEMTQTIPVSVAGNYSVTITNPDGCSAVKNFTVKQDLVPIQTMVDINENNIHINFSTPNLEYSINGLNTKIGPHFTICLAVFIRFTSERKTAVRKIRLPKKY